MAPIKNPEISGEPRKAQLDPLYVIFEQHLYNFQDPDTDRKTFIGNVIQDYLTYLRKLSVVIPKSLEDSIVEELSSQVNTMLVKKIYGCLSIRDYQKKVPSVTRRRTQGRYTRLKKIFKNQKPKTPRSLD